MYLGGELYRLPPANNYIIKSASYVVQTPDFHQNFHQESYNERAGALFYLYVILAK